MKEKIYLVTGAAGHLGNTIVSQLIQEGKSVRALALPFDNAAERLPECVEIIRGDVTNKDSLIPFFSGCDGKDVTVIHAAGIVSIAS